MLLFNSKVNIIKLNKESTWISYSTISISNFITVIPGGYLSGSKVKELSWSTTKTSYATSSFRPNFPADAVPTKHFSVITWMGQQDGNIANGLGSTTLYQRPALNYKKTDILA